MAGMLHPHTLDTQADQLVSQVNANTAIIERSKAHPKKLYTFTFIFIKTFHVVFYTCVRIPIHIFLSAEFYLFIK